jgi:hypothetical protein
MRFVFKPVLKQHANRHDGITLGTNYVRLSKRAAAQLAGTDAVRLAYDLTAKAICIRPVQGASNLTAEGVFKISQAKGNDPQIYCAVLSQVMPRGHYAFRKKTPHGVIFVYAEGKAGKMPARQAGAVLVAGTKGAAGGKGERAKERKKPSDDSRGLSVTG